MNDRQLLEDYALRNSQEAFAALVQRHINLVYSVALRCVGDPHKAQDVTQSVFILLAQKASRLHKNTVLTGWLYQTARLTSATFRRGELRRQRREQEAFMQSSLEDATSSAPWEALAPVLDDALGRLGEVERNAILLRYFEDRSVSEVALALGLKEAGARKRLVRALEKLRSRFAKRGIALSAGALSAAITANAVQAAPAGLAGAITGAIAAGTALHPAAATAVTKVIAMTTAQKAVLAAVLAGALGTGIYQGHQLSLRAAAAQTLSQETDALAAQVRQLERTRDEATNLLAAVRADNARLKSSQHLTELLRLRGQVGALRQELATTGPGAYPNVAAQLMQDPAMKRILRDNIRQSVLNDYGALFKELKLTPQQIDQAARLSADLGFKLAEDLVALTPGTVSQAQLAQMARDTVAEAFRQLQPILGEDGVARLKTIREELPARATVNLLNSQLLEDKPLSDQQSSRLVEVVKAEPFDLTWGMVNGEDMAFWATPQDVEAHLANIEASNARVLQQASSFLSSEQLSALSTVLSNGINARIISAAAYIQKH